MMMDKQKVALVFASAAVAGILLIFLFSETPRKASVAESLAAAPNSLLEVFGSAENISKGKFQLCDKVCISIKAEDLPSARLLYPSCKASVIGRVKEYKGRKYIEAERIELA